MAWWQQLRRACRHADIAGGAAAPLQRSTCGLGARAITVPAGAALQDYLEDGEIIYPESIPDWQLEPGERIHPDDLAASATASMITQRGGGLGSSLPTAAMLRNAGLGPFLAAAEGNNNIYESTTICDSSMQICKQLGDLQHC